jgi:hypothetical protein
MTAEKEIQDWVVELVRTGKLRDEIAGGDDVDRVIAAARDESFIPTFPIDYLLRRRAAEAAASVLKRIEAYELVAERKDISADPKERLFPDLVMAALLNGGLAAVEVKAAETTEREAATELLAYDFELSNHLPFGAHVDRMLIVIATDFAPLMEHAVSSLIVWGGRQILCLRYTVDGTGPKLSVHERRQLPRSHESRRRAARHRRRSRATSTRRKTLPRGLRPERRHVG